MLKLIFMLIDEELKMKMKEKWNQFVEWLEKKLVLYYNIFIELLSKK